MTQVPLLVALLATMTMLVLAVAVVYRWPTAGAAVILAVAVVMWDVPVLPTLVSVGGTSIQIGDVISVVLLGSALLSWKRLRENIGAAGVVCWMTFLVLVGGSIFRGIAELGLGLAMNEARLFILVLASMTWALTLEWTAARVQRLIFRGGMVAGWALVAVAIWHVTLYGFGSVSSFVEVNGVLQTGRPLVAEQTVVLAMSAFAVLAGWMTRRGRAWLLSGMVFLGTAVVAQHRSVWVALLVGAVVALLFATSRARGRLVVASVVIAWSTAVVVLASGGVASLSDLQDSAGDTGTIEDRYSGWVSLIDQSFATGPFGVVFGQPFGSGFERESLDGSLIAYSPHNWLITVYLRAGAVGVLAFVGLIIVLFRRASRAPTPAAARAILALAVVFGFAYAWPWTAAVFLGLTIARPAPVGDDQREISRAPASASP